MKQLDSERLLENGVMAATSTLAAVSQNYATEKPSPEGGWSTSVTRLHNAILQPPQGKRPLTFPASVFSSDQKVMHEAAVWRGPRRITLDAEPPERTNEHYPGTWMWGGLLYNHFGHFLCESTSRLWALDYFSNDIEGILFFAKWEDRDVAPASYHRGFVQLMGADCPIRVVRSPSTVEQLLVPGQGFGLGDMASGTDIFRQAIQTRFGTKVLAAGGRKLYISRSEMSPRKGGLLFEKHLETLLVAQGYDIFHPQKHSLAEQIARYKAATHVLAAEGSALHLFAMVARADQKVGIVVRRQSGATRSIARHIKAFSGKRPQLIEAIHRHWMPKDGIRKHMSVAELDFPQLQKRLTRSGFISPTEEWSRIDEQSAENEIMSQRFRRVMNYQPLPLAP